MIGWGRFLWSAMCSRSNYMIIMIVSCLKDSMTPPTNKNSIGRLLKDSTLLSWKEWCPQPKAERQPCGWYSGRNWGSIPGSPIRPWASHLVALCFSSQCVYVRNNFLSYKGAVRIKLLIFERH